MPRRFRLVAALPREDNGKLVRARLLALFDDAAAPEQRTVALTIPPDWHFFRGHFDHFPILAGVVQLSEIVMREVRACWPEHRHLRRVTGLKFRRPIGPGDELELELVRTPPGQDFVRDSAAAARSPARARSNSFATEPGR